MIQKVNIYLMSLKMTFENFLNCGSICHIKHIIILWLKKEKEMYLKRTLN